MVIGYDYDVLDTTQKAWSMKDVTIKLDFTEL